MVEPDFEILPGDLGPQRSTAAPSSGRPSTAAPRPSAASTTRISARGMPEIVIDGAAGAKSCPVCQGVIATLTGLAQCKACRTQYHQECARAMLDRCATPNCSGRLAREQAPRPEASPQTPGRSRQHRDGNRVPWVAIVVALVVIAIIASVIASTAVARDKAGARSSPEVLMQPTPTATRQVVARTATPTATATATPAPRSGDVLLGEDFSDAGNRSFDWDSDVRHSRIDGGSLLLWQDGGSEFVTQSSFFVPERDVYISVSGYSENDSLILACRNSGPNQQYRANVYSGGYGSIDIGNHTRLAAGDAPMRGGSFNHIEFICAGSVLSLWVNSVLVARAEDSTYPDGSVWIGINGSGSTATSGRFDDLVIARP